MYHRLGTPPLPRRCRTWGVAATHTGIGPKRGVQVPAPAHLTAISPSTSQQVPPHLLSVSAFTARPHSLDATGICALEVWDWAILSNRRPASTPSPQLWKVGQPTARTATHALLHAQQMAR
jgi:hypothetical protein